MKLRFRRRPRPASLSAPARPDRAGRTRDLVHDAYQAALDEAFADGYNAALDDRKLIAALAELGRDVYSDRLAITATDTVESLVWDPADPNQEARF